MPNINNSNKVNQKVIVNVNTHPSKPKRTRKTVPGASSAGAGPSSTSYYPVQVLGGDPNLRPHYFQTQATNEQLHANNMENAINNLSDHNDFQNNFIHNVIPQTPVENVEPPLNQVELPAPTYVHHTGTHTDMIHTHNMGVQQDGPQPPYVRHTGTQHQPEHTKDMGVGDHRVPNENELQLEHALQYYDDNEGKPNRLSALKNLCSKLGIDTTNKNSIQKLKKAIREHLGMDLN